MNGPVMFLLGVLVAVLALVALIQWMMLRAFLKAMKCLKARNPEAARAVLAALKEVRP